MPRPFLKWAGGKGQVLVELRKALPSKFKAYHEPFCGGAALFFDLKPSRATLSDNNVELIECYRSVRDDTEAVVRRLRRYKYDKELYYKVRAQDPWKLKTHERAARMIYLNRTGFNGLYRVNKSGKFNVPFGKYVNPNICDVENLTACAEQLKAVNLEETSFETVLSRAKKGDFVYFDPPYIPLSKTANFTAYQRNGFGMDNQEKLAEVYDKLSKKGVLCMLSNSDVAFMHERYSQYNIRVIAVRRSVNCNPKNRGPVGEVLVTNY